MTREEIRKIVSLEILTYYDERIKAWVDEKSLGSLTEEELREIVRDELDKYTALIFVD